jgi:hypothetical protein
MERRFRLKVRDFVVLWRFCKHDPNPPNSRRCPYPGLRKGRSNYPTILLPREVDDCWKLPYVLGRGGAGSQACGVLCLACTAWNGGQDRLAACPQGERGCHGISPCQSPARLPYLRSGRRVRSPGSIDAIRRRPRTIPRGWWQACCGRQERRALDQGWIIRLLSTHCLLTPGRLL